MAVALAVAAGSAAACVEDSVVEEGSAAVAVSEVATVDVGASGVVMEGLLGAASMTLLLLLQVLHHQTHSLTLLHPEESRVI